jgi:hypothetical protein
MNSTDYSEHAPWTCSLFWPAQSAPEGSIKASENGISEIQPECQFEFVAFRRLSDNNYFGGGHLLPLRTASKKNARLFFDLLQPGACRWLARHSRPDASEMALCGQARKRSDF